MLSNISKNNKNHSFIFRLGGLQPILLIARYGKGESKVKADEVQSNLNSSKVPPEIASWKTRDVGLWLDTYVGLSPDNIDEFIYNQIDGPILLKLENTYISHFKSELITSKRIALFEAISDLKREVKAWRGYDTFFSYRRVGGSELARLYLLELRDEFNIFIDVEGLTSGTFDSEIFRKIEEATNCVVFITDGSLQKCINNPNDWVRKEIAYALKLKKKYCSCYCYYSITNKRRTT